MNKTHQNYKAPAGFTIFEGGPFHGLWERLGFINTRLDYRSVVLPLAAWLPMFLLSAWEGRAWSGVKIPFLLDWETQARFLFALPLLLWAERFADLVLIPALENFANCGLVRDADQAQFRKIMAARVGVNNSLRAALPLALFPVWIVGHVFWKSRLMPGDGAWYGAFTDSGLQWSLAGWWLSWLAMPLFQFFLYRWIIRLIRWWGLLIKLARLDLHLVPTHPDRAGGLDFLGYRAFAFAPFLFAQGTTVLGIFSYRIFHGKGHLYDYVQELAMFAAFMLALVLGPFTAFTRSLARAKRLGRDEFSNLAQRYVQEFERKWILGGAPANEPLVGSPDVQSLADLAGAAELPRGMKLVPISVPAVVTALLAFALPIVPLLLTVIPAKEMFFALLKMLL